MFLTISFLLDFSWLCIKPKQKLLYIHLYCLFFFKLLIDFELPRFDYINH